MRLADRHGRPLSEVLSDYPDWEIPYWNSWINREPDSGRRVELLLARFLSTWLSAHMKKRSSAPGPGDLIWPDWYRDNHHLTATRDDVQTLVDLFKDSGVAVRVNKR